MKRIKKTLILFSLLLLSFILWNNLSISKQTKPHLFSSVTEIPHAKYGVILGTSKITRSGNENAYFFHRIDAAVALIDAKKIDSLVISGDHKNETYNEISDIKEELIKRGISPTILCYDPKGFDTYSSMKNMRKWVKNEDFTIISQRFHNQRAIYIAQHLGLKTNAFNAQDVNKSYGFFTSLREHFARIKMQLKILFVSL